MGTLDKRDIRLFDMTFDVYNQKPHYIELKSRSGQFWCVYKEDDTLVVLLHKHHSGDEYHVHFLFTDATDALSEIMQHERYIEKRNKNKEKLCGNRKLNIVF